MYRVLVVDDEPLMRTFLAKKIPEFVEQFEVCGTAQDGQEAESTIGRIFPIFLRQDTVP